MLRPPRLVTNALGMAIDSRLGKTAERDLYTRNGDHVFVLAELVHVNDLISPALSAG